MSAAKLATSLLLVLCLGGKAAGAEPPSYPAGPLEGTLSDWWRARITSALGLESLSDLPLYQLDATLDTESSELQGRMTLNFRNNGRAPLDRLVFRLYHNEKMPSRAPIRISGIRAGGREITATSEPVLVVPLPAPLEPGRRVLVEMEFTVQIPQIALEAGGLSQFLGGSGGGYGTLGHRAGIFNLAWFHPILAAWKKGGWDMAPAARFGDFANQDVANYLVKLEVPAGTRVASTGVELGRRPSGEGRVELFLAAAAVRHFAIQASAGYEIFESTSGGTRVRVFTYGKNESLARRLAEEASRALRWFEKRLVAYPFTELDVAVAPLVQGAGGMEHPGLAVVADMAVEPPLAGPMGGIARQLLESFSVAEFVVDHEVAHQWFQVLVGTDQSAEPYVDEPLANYLAVMAFEDLHGSRKAEQQLELQLVLPLQLWFALGGRDGIVARPAVGFADQLEYTALVYGKASLFYHDLRRRAGKKRLLKCLSGICRDFGFRRLDASALFSRLGKCLHIKGFSTLWGRWLRKTQVVKDLERLGIKVGQSVDELLGLLAGTGTSGGNVTFGGQVDEALLRAFQQALDQLTSP